MNRFTVEFSSSPPSEHLPSNSPHQQRRNIFSVPDNPASTTPAAPPPSQLFGSSQFETGIGKLQFTRESKSFDSSAPKSHSSQRAKHGTAGLQKNRMFEISTNTYASEDQDEYYTEDMMDDEDEDEEEYTRGVNTGKLTAPSLMTFNTSAMQQSQRRSVNRRTVGFSRSRLPRKGHPEIVPGLATDISRRMGAASLTEPDDIILGTEDLLRSFDEKCQACTEDSSMKSVTTVAAQQLILQWKRRSRYSSVSTGQSLVGPDAKSTAFEKAQYLSTLLLELRHPEPVMEGAESIVVAERRGGNKKPMPEVLLAWLDHHHVNYGPLFEQVITTTPAPSANELYWDAIETFTLRGKFEEVMELLRRGDLNYAVVDTPDGSKNAGFSGIQLQKAEDAIYRARQLVNTCPALQAGDWTLEGQDWDVYRKQLEAEIASLAEQVNSQDHVIPQEAVSQNIFSKAPGKSGLPFMIYQRLKTVYSIMLGDADEIIGLAQDWVEASILLTVWWIPTDENGIAQWSFDVSKAGDPRLNGGSRYLKRLSDAFLCVTDFESESAFQLNTMDPVEVGLGAVLQGDIQSCLQILQSLSLCAASAVAEIGSWGGWLDSPLSSVGLNAEDLMVLNYGTNDTAVEKDDVLELYAHALLDKDNLYAADGGEVEGWELSFSILSRLDDQERMHASISKMLPSLPITDQERTAKLVDICEQFGLVTESRKVSENFADSLVNDTTNYGTALLCYARAHAEHKVRQLIDLLNSYCLVQSQAYPADDEMDAALIQLVSNPKSALQNISDADPQAAEMLHFYLVGYACIRRFYSLRDGHDVKGVHLRPIAKKKAAATALVAAINSAADSIYGGLYDSNRQTAIQVDGLLTLLGEATALIAQKGRERIFSSEQMYALLAAVEDLQTVNERVYRAAEECMEAALRNYLGSLPPSPHAMLKKSVSSGTNSNFSFSMMGSEMLARSEESIGGKSLGSAVLVGTSGREVQRGWDWRMQFKDRNTTGIDVLRRLRHSIAKELSVATVEERSIDL